MALNIQRLNLTPAIGDTEFGGVNISDFTLFYANNDLFLTQSHCRSS